MANYFLLTLDTISPSSANVIINSGSAYATSDLVTLAISTTDNPTTGYTMKVWGNVDSAYNVNIQSTEGASTWIAYQTSLQVKLASGDGSKTVFLKIRDDVYNESAQVSDTIILDTSVPVGSIEGIDRNKISKVSGRNVASFGFTVDSIFEEYKIKVVSAINGQHDTGVQILTTNGSVNMSGNAGNYPASTVINCQITGADLEVASAGNGQKIVKLFVKDQSGNWSV